MAKDTDVFSNTMKVLDEMERLESGSYALVNHFYRS